MRPSWRPYSPWSCKAAIGATTAEEWTNNVTLIRYLQRSPQSTPLNSQGQLCYGWFTPKKGADARLYNDVLCAWCYMLSTNHLVIQPYWNCFVTPNSSPPLYHLLILPICKPHYRARPLSQTSLQVNVHISNASSIANEE